MNEDATHLAREAKSLQHTLKESLKTKDPWDRETDFTRKQLRRNCLRLLLLHPFAPESKDAETMLWIQTSYAFISLYKQRIAALDRAIHGGTRQQQGQQQQGQGQGQGQQQPRQHGGHGVVEYRKLLQRFRQFLADEEKFWIQLIVRIRRIFQLDGAQPILAQLEIMPEEEPSEEGGPPKRNHFQFPSDADVVAAAPSLTPSNREQRESRMAILSKALVCLGDIERYKEQYNEAGGRPRAGHEDGPPAIMPNNQKGRGRKGGAAPPNGAPLLARMRDYHKAQQCYQQARLLLPQDGNPAHQMAIIASYQKDTFSSLVHYYRALCVRSPYDTAADNLGTVLTKALETWKSRGAKKEKERDKDQARGVGETISMAPRLRVEAFKERLIVIHALWRLPPEEAETMGANLAQKIADDFKGLVSERVLPFDIILKTIVLAQGALWKHRVFRGGSSHSHRRSVPAGAAAAIESSIATHLVSMHRVLLEVGIVQIAEAPPEDAGEHDLAQRITAEFRRTLPALRIAGKWLRSNSRYLGQAWQQLFASEDGESSSSKPKGRDRNRRGGDRRSSGGALVIHGIMEFWRAYAQFSTALTRAFPQDKLPKTSTSFEEDIELAGFLPLKKLVPSEIVGTAAAPKEGAKDARNGTTSPGFQVVQPDEVHPNEEQLMRIADLIADAHALVKDDATPLRLSEGRFFIQEGQVQTTRPSAQKSQPQANVPSPPTREPPRQHRHENSLSHVPLPPVREYRGPEMDDDSMTDVTRTEDGVVGDVVRMVLGPSTDTGDEDEEDEIVWNPGAPPAAPPLLHDPAVVAAVPIHATLPASSPPRPHIPSPIIPTVPTLTPRSPPSIPPSSTQRRSSDTTPSKIVHPPPSVTTAQDLLANVLHRSPPKGESGTSFHARQASAPSFMLFGSNPLGRDSIWSSGKGDVLDFQGATGTPKGLSHQSYPQPPQAQVPAQAQHAQPSLYPLQSSLSLGQGTSSFSLGQSPPPFALGQGASSLGHTQGTPSLGLGRPQGLSPVGHTHQRVQSLSLGHSQILPSSPSSQLFPPSSQGQPMLPDGFGSYPALTEQAAVTYSTGVPSAYADPVYSRKLDATSAYLRQEAPAYPERSVPYHIDPRTNGAQVGAHLPLSAMAQLWNNTG
ncbi:hypothetical protein GY45DRAFT_1371115 [Cubamyces sp. BRFM 1775]|nr:hypothetical protein GY45DRAFT_1371115 [Cubamyces sp. BRFM 1775]